MHSITHRLAGVGLGFAVIATMGDYITAAGVVIGSTAPDFLEIPRWNNGARSSVLNHRTITHWFPLWFLLIGYAWLHRFGSNEFDYFLWTFFFGYGLGGLLHILMDMATPMGVPIVLPFAKNRKHFKWKF
jgi:membrane-bound metal-dependent hydrolase YbcI (DUF457 family)